MTAVSNPTFNSTEPSACCFGPKPPLNRRSRTTSNVWSWTNRLGFGIEPEKPDAIGEARKPDDSVDLVDDDPAGGKAFGRAESRQLRFPRARTHPHHRERHGSPRSSAVPAHSTPSFVSTRLRTWSVNGKRPSSIHRPSRQRIVVRPLNRPTHRRSGSTVDCRIVAALKSRRPTLESQSPCRRPRRRARQMPAPAAARGGPATVSSREAATSDSRWREPAEIWAGDAPAAG